MELQVGVKILIENDKQQFLLLKRSAIKYPEVGEKWDIPGGRIDPGTPLSENLAREVREETGLEIVGTPTLIGAQDILKPDKHVVRLTYKGKATGSITLSDEHFEFKWFTKGEMQNLEHLDKYVKEIIVEL
jgi:8-oxo-dGTP diphosphatase